MAEWGGAPIRRRSPWPLVAGALLGLLAAWVLLHRLGRPAGPPGVGSTRAPGPAPPTAARLAPAAAGRAPEPVAPRVEPAPKAQHGDIVGRVVSAADGSPVAHAELTFASPSGAAVSARADEQGGFTFTPDQTGTWQLASARAEGFLPFGPEWGRSPLQLTFRQGERVRGVVVALTPAPERLGRVLGEDGTPAAGATVRMLVPKRDELVLFPLRERFVTDAAGELRFRAEAHAVLEASHPRLGTGSAEVEEGQAAVVITLEPLAPDAGARGTLSGRVLWAGSPVAGAVVHASSALRAYPKVFGAPDGYRELTDEDGRFELTDLEPGTYDVSARSRGLAPAHAFDVRAPAKGLTLELGAGPRLEGRVTDEAGGPVPAFTLTLLWKKAPLEHLGVVEAGFVDPHGRYRVDGIAEGSYALEVEAVGFSPASAEVTVGSSAVTADLQLERGARVSGVVRTEGSRAPVALARVQREGQGLPLTTSDSSGAFVLEGLPRRGFSLQVSALGHNTRVVTVADAAAPLDIELGVPAGDAGAKIELTGIGCVLRGRGDALVIGQVLEGAGASAAGLKTGDELTAVDGRAVAELGFEPAIRAIRGPVGSPVELTVRKQGAPPAAAVLVVRKKVSN